MTKRRTVGLLVRWVLISVAFGVVDERLTRLSFTPVADAANSRLLWACWPVVVGLGTGRVGRGLVTGAVGTYTALAAFEFVHGNSIANALGGPNSFTATVLLVGAAGGAIGGAIRDGLRASRS